MWEFLTTAEYREWVLKLEDQDRARLQRVEQRLIAEGPLLRRPHTDTVRGSNYKDMKELRPTPTIRAFYALDPWRRIVMLCGGDKASARQGTKWYKKMIRRADRLYRFHLENHPRSPSA